MSLFVSRDNFLNEVRVRDIIFNRCPVFRQIDRWVPYGSPSRTIFVWKELFRIASVVNWEQTMDSASPSSSIRWYVSCSSPLFHCFSSIVHYIIGIHRNHGSLHVEVEVEAEHQTIRLPGSIHLSGNIYQHCCVGKRWQSSRICTADLLFCFTLWHQCNNGSLFR